MFRYPPPLFTRDGFRILNYAVKAFLIHQIKSALGKSQCVGKTALCDIFSFIKSNLSILVKSKVLCASVWQFKILKSAQANSASQLSFQSVGENDESSAQLVSNGRALAQFCIFTVFNRA